MKLFLCICLICLPTALFSSPIQPKLVADLIESEVLDGKQVQVAKGNVKLTYEEIVIFADVLRFDQEKGEVVAEGSIILDSPLGRTKSETLSLDLKSGQFSMTQTRLSRPPLYLKSDSAQGNNKQINLKKGEAFYGQPDGLSPNIKSETITYYKDGEIETNKTYTRVGIIPFFYLPSLDWDAEVGSPLHYYGDFGFRSELGLFLHNKFLYQYSSNLAIGGSVDLFSERGFLLGPELTYSKSGEDGNFLKGTLSGGFINDQGDTDLDIFDNSIPEERGFFTWKHSQKKDQLSLVAQVNYWSDSEVIRDFRSDQYEENQAPQNYIEIDYLDQNILYSLFTEFSPNGFQNQVTRLPQIRVDLLTSPILQDQFYHKGFLEYSRLKRETALNSVFEPEVNRFDAYYGWNVDYKLKRWATLTGIGGGRLTHYSDTLENNSFTRMIGEFGLDLRLRYEAIWETKNELWKIDGLRHLAEPVIQYRFIPAADAGQNKLFDIDRNLLRNYPLLLDLSDQRFTDNLPEQHLIRIGHENTLQTRSKTWGSRTLAQWNVYQDILLDTESDQDTLSNTYSFIRLSPIEWLSFHNYLKWNTTDIALEESYLGFSFRDGDLWSLRFDQAFIENETDQYNLYGQYRINERLRLHSELRYNANLNRLHRYGIGLEKHFGNAWNILFTLTRFEGSEREGGLEFRMRVKLIRF